VKEMRTIETAVMLGNGLKKRTEMHWARKLWHVLGVCILAYIYQSLPPTTSEIALLILWLIAVPGDFIRLKVPVFNEIMTHLFGPIMRDSEAKNLAGTTYLLSGVLLIELIFPREIVILTLIFLAFADPIASIIGIKYGKDKIFGHKSLQGSTAAFIVCATATYAVLSYKGIMTNRIFIVSLLGGLIEYGN
jgi:diacylglycerol kinase (CTP)